MTNAPATRVRKSDMTLHPCASCRRNPVRKEGGLCRSCASKAREERLIAEGVPRTWNRTHRKGGGGNHSTACPKSPTGAHFQKITTDKDGITMGECIYCHRKFDYPQESRDKKKKRAQASNRKGGLKRRGRPRKSRAGVKV